MEPMPDARTLGITIKCSDRYLGISFEDTGVGIEQDALGGLFEPYHTTKEDGSGLGLMIVQRIVQDHGGQIEVLSEPGSGHTFTMYLPIDDQRIRLLTQSTSNPEA